MIRYILRRSHGQLGSPRHLATSTSTIKPKPKVSFLDLHNSGLSAIERLCLEEAILRHDPMQRSWAIVGAHDPVHHTYLRPYNENVAPVKEDCIIIMGLSGKPERLLNVEKVQQDGVLTVKRFSGGGTVVVDHSSLWTTFIGRNKDFPHIKPFPRNIMEWSADDVFNSVFQRMKEDAVRNRAKLNRRSLVVDTKSCGLAQGTGKTVKHGNDASSQIDESDFPDFSLRENDYVLGHRKIGGNAQAIVKGGWLHHTSFLWDFDDENMGYLTLPERRPEYRADRNHDDFLIKAKSIYGENGGSLAARRVFFHHVKSVAEEAFDVDEVTLKDALSVVDEVGGMQAWFEKSRTRILEL